MTEILFGTTKTKDEELYCVYCHRNKINGKRYIGQTIYQDNPELRWKTGTGYIGCRAFYNAIQKYGWDAFDHYVIQDKLTKEEADELETLNIAFYNTTDNRYGYNLQSGGSKGKLSEETKQIISNLKMGNKCCVGRIMSEETKQKISNSLIGNTNTSGKIIVYRGSKQTSISPNKLQEYLNNGWVKGVNPKNIVKPSQETKDKISMANRGKTPWNKGVARSEETKQKISNSLKGNHISEEQKKSISQNHKGKIGVNNGIINKQIYPNQLSEYEQQGFVRGYMSYSN